MKLGHVGSYPSSATFQPCVLGQGLVLPGPNPLCKMLTVAPHGVVVKIKYAKNWYTMWAVGMLAAFESEAVGEGGKREVVFGGPGLMGPWREFCQDAVGLALRPSNPEGREARPSGKKLYAGEAGGGCRGWAGKEGWGVRKVSLACWGWGSLLPLGWSLWLFFFFLAIRSSVAAAVSPRSPLAGPGGGMWAELGQELGKVIRLIKSASFWFSLPGAG